MANEAVKRYDESSGHGGVIQDYTCADTDAFEKGTLLMLADPRTASGSVTIGAACVGICAREKVKSDGRTQVSVYKKGYFDMIASGAITVGTPVMAAGHANYVHALSGPTWSGSSEIGVAEEEAAADETILIRLDL